MEKNYDVELELCSNCGRETAYLDEERSSDEREVYICTNCGCHYICRSCCSSIEMIKGTKREWLGYLQENLSFPFTGVISEYQGRGLLQEGDTVIVTKVDSEDDLYGVIAAIKEGRKKYYFPICDIYPVDETSVNYQILKDYHIWFANCTY